MVATTLGTGGRFNLLPECLGRREVFVLERAFAHVLALRCLENALAVPASFPGTLTP
jgi:hypothetical protein